MYNRYIPQPDGSFRRQQVPSPDPAGHRPHERKPAPAPATLPPPESLSQQPPQPREHVRHTPRKPSGNTSAGSFLRQLLPKDFGTEDLLVVLLLLLMAGDDPKKQNSALLTLSVYLFL